MPERLRPLSQEVIDKKTEEKVVNRLVARVIAYPIIGALANIGLAEVDHMKDVESNKTTYLAFGAATGLLIFAYRTVQDIRAMGKDDILTPRERQI